MDADDRAGADGVDAHARRPEDITRLFVEFSNAGDADAVAGLYEEDAVMAFPPGQVTRGRAAIRRLWAAVLAERPRFAQEEPAPALIAGDLALTATAAKDGKGVRVQVARRQPDGRWLRVLDHPELDPAALAGAGAASGGGARTSSPRLSGGAPGSS